ncbi:hypothetical protein E4T38_04597 [Aureobasidium subglaciale]|nr:hypothetical protein E4T38_04597 [Aureobasidium subglaciale]KAI5223786.1 hypothetical protein E4T40_04373 [Aureobasidium subglaciale]KAI5227092.1 hypothetical protein E4T41_04502 [Aureobasidium subglaciale]KAI5262540.1 hypothetical protein E4T46_04388 [Aureobasidium subglaciale]
MAELLTRLLSDPLVDNNGDRLRDVRGDESVRKLVKYMRSLKAQDVPLQVQGKPLVELLDPSRNTIGYLAVLLAYAQQAVLAQQVALVTTFLSRFDPVQARYVGPEMQQLLIWLTKYYDHSKDPSVIPYIATAILRLDPESSTLTSTHLLLLRLCLAAGLPRQALRVLDKDIYNLPMDPQKGVDERFACADHDLSATYITKASNISATLTAPDVHEYYLLGAYAYIGLRRYNRARLFLELVLGSPSQNVATPLMVEAYKKSILVSLLSTGSLSFTKGLINPQMIKTYSSLSKPYEVLADVFKKRDVLRLDAEIAMATAVWDEDGNTAIVNQVADSLRRYRVIDLQKTYAALPIEGIALHLNLTPGATTTLLSTMIRDGHLHALLPPLIAGTDTKPVLRFLSQNPNQPAVDHDALLKDKSVHIEQLAKHVREADRRLAIQKEYVDFTRRNKRAETAGAQGYEDPMDVWDAPEDGDQDEDMMGDL